MGFTMGEMMIYGGIAIVVFAILGVVISAAAFSASKKKMIEKLSNLY